MNEIDDNSKLSEFD